MSKVWIWSSNNFKKNKTVTGLMEGSWNKVVLKPNWIRHYNERDPSNPDLLKETVTSTELLLAIARQIKPHVQEKLVVADAPQFDSNWDIFWVRMRLDAFQEELRKTYEETPIDIRDLRQEVVETDKNNVILNRDLKMGDPEGYQIINIADRSMFNHSGFDMTRVRGADFDPKTTIQHHTNGRHEYCVAKTILNANLVVNVPKVKTHKKSGVTLCLKNLVGINGNKNFLPHHRAGSPQKGGDEYPGGGQQHWTQRVRAWGIDRVRPIIQNENLAPIVRILRGIDMKTRSKESVRNGNWHGNDTIWRMILDLNRILMYADSDGKIHETPQREVFHIQDAIIAGEGEGPMAPDRKEVGLVVCSADPVAADIVTSSMMGFDPWKIPVIREALKPHPLPITSLGEYGEGLDIIFDGNPIAHWRELPNYSFRPHKGWAGMIERV